MTETSASSAPQVDGALSAWNQGDCVVGEQWFVFRRADGEEGIQQELVEGFVVVTQSCDIVRSVQRRPLVEVSPLVKVENRAPLEEIRKGRMLQYAFLPGVAAQGLVADLDRTMTIHKEVVARWARVPGCGTDAEVRQLAEMLARKRQRFAFPDDFTALVRPLQERFREKHDKQSPEGEAMRAFLTVAMAWGWSVGISAFAVAARAGADSGPGYFHRPDRFPNHHHADRHFRSDHAEHGVQCQCWLWHPVLACGRRRGAEPDLCDNRSRTRNNGRRRGKPGWHGQRGADPGRCDDGYWRVDVCRRG